ncbi:MAG: hypothetical protein ACR2GG_10960 [Gemmatimonadaceae bacterium]|jgi:hypothetical protein
MLVRISMYLDQAHRLGSRLSAEILDLLSGSYRERIPSDRMERSGSIESRRYLLKGFSATNSLKLAAIALILLVGMIHFVDAPDSFSEALYKGLLFTANGVGALVAAMGIFLDRRNLGWNLGALVAGGAFVMYVISRTVGLPGLGVDVWFEPLGILSLVAEALYIVVYMRVTTKKPLILAEDRAE